MVVAEWNASEKAPVLEVVSTFSTINRATDFSKRNPAIKIDPATAKFATAPTELIPTDGIVRKTALRDHARQEPDIEKARAIYDWIVDNTQRNPKTRGCGIGDIKAMLETGDCRASAPISTRSTSASRARWTCRRATSTACAWRRATSATAASASAART